MSRLTRAEKLAKVYGEDNKWSIADVFRNILEPDVVGIDMGEPTGSQCTVIYKDGSETIKKLTFNFNKQTQGFKQAFWDPEGRSVDELMKECNGGKNEE